MNSRSKTHWIVIALMCGLTGSSIGICNNSIGVFYSPVSESLGVLRGTFAIHSTLSLIATGVMSIFLPALMRRFHYRVILVAGTVLATASTVAMAFSGSVYLFYVLGVLRGIGAACFAAVPVTMTINNWFEEKNGLATSLAMSFSGVIGAVASPILSWCIESFGWQTAYIIQGVTVFALALPAILYPYTPDPRAMHLMPYGHVSRSEIKTRKARTKVKFNYLSVGFICFAVLSLLQTSISGIGQHMTGMAESIGFHAAVGATMVSCAMVGNIGTKLIIGVLSDRFGAMKACVSMLVANIVALLIIYAGSVWSREILLYVGAVIYGSVYSVGAVGIALMTKYFFGLENYAAVYSKIGLVTNVGAAVSLTIVGYVYDYTGSYDYALFGGIALNIIIIALLVVTAKATGKMGGRR